MKATEQNRYGAAEKCRLVLSVWMEKKKASVLCREQGISSSLFCQWQDRALSGMLEALEPRGRREGVDGPALPMLIKRLLDRKVRSTELERVGQRMNWRNQPTKTKVIQQTVPSPAGS
jgi:hypothetical protein